MNRTGLDILIIADKGGFENVAFPVNSAWLSEDGEVMTLQALRQRALRAAGLPVTPHEPVRLEDSGKLNGIYLYDYCRRSGLEAELSMTHDPADPNFRAACAEKPRVVAISTTWMLSAKGVRRAVDDIRSLCPDAYIVVGGPLVYNSFNAWKTVDLKFDPKKLPVGDLLFFYPETGVHDGVDLFIINEQGEDILVEAVRALAEGRDPRTLPNVAWPNGRTLEFSQREDRRLSLDDSTVVRWDQIPSRHLPKIVPMYLSMGCPYKCTFCDYTAFRDYRTKSLDTIRTEMLQLKARRDEIRMLRFVDDTLTAKRLRDVCQLMIDVDLDIPWTSFARADSVSAENVPLIRKSRCQSLQLGLESGDDTILLNMDKRATTSQYLRTLEMLNREGVNVRAMLIVGFPGETPQTVDNTIAFLDRVPTEGEGLFEYVVASFIVMPLSPVNTNRKLKESFGLDGVYFKWRHNTMTSDEVWQHHARLLTAPSNDVFVRYHADDCFPGIPRQELKRILADRQNLQRLRLRGGGVEEQQLLWDRLESAFVRHQRAASREASPAPS